MEQKQGKDRIQILTTLDQNYLPRLQVLLTSLYLNQPNEKLDIWLLHSRIPTSWSSTRSARCGI